MKTSKEIWDSYPDKNSFEWLNRGVYAYNVLLKREMELNKDKFKKKK